MGMVQQLVSVLRTPHSQFHEHVVGTLCWYSNVSLLKTLMDKTCSRVHFFTLLHLCSLVEDCPQGLRDCRDPALGLEMFLKQRSGELRGKEENEVSLGLDAEMIKLVSKCNVSPPLKICQ